MWWLLFCFFGFAAGQNCTADDQLCQACSLQASRSPANIKSVYTAPFCNILFIIDDHNTVNSSIDRCTTSFLSSSNLTVSCQLPVFTDFNLTTVYTNSGLRATPYSYFIGMVRGENCSSQMFYEAKNGFRTPNGNTSEPCDKTRAVFEGTNVTTVNPSTFHTNSFACQCAKTLEELPGTKTTHSSFFYLTTAFMIFLNYF